MKDNLNQNFETSSESQKDFWVDTLKVLQAPSGPTQQFWVDYTKTSKIPENQIWFWVKIDWAKQIFENNQQLRDSFFQQQQNLIDSTQNILSDLVSEWDDIFTPAPKLNNPLWSNYKNDLVDFTWRIAENRTYKPIFSNFEWVKLQTDDDYKKYQQLQKYYWEKRDYNIKMNEYYDQLNKWQNSPQPRWIAPQKPDIKEPLLDPSLNEMDKKIWEFYEWSNKFFESTFWDEKQRQKLSQDLKDWKITLDQIRGKLVEKINQAKTFEEKLQIANQILIGLNQYYDSSYYTQITKDGKHFLQADVLTKTLDPINMWQTVLNSDTSKKAWVCRDYHSELADILRQAWMEAYSASVESTQPHTVAMVKNEWKVYLLDRSTTQSFNSFSDAFSFYEQKEWLVSAEWHFVVGKDWKPIQIITTENWEALREIISDNFFSQMDWEIDTNWISTTYSATFDKNNKLVSVDFNNWKWHFDVDWIMKQVNWTNFLAWKIWTEYSINDTLAVFAKLAVWQMTPDQQKIAIASNYLKDSKPIDFAWANIWFRGKWNWKTVETDSWTTKINSSAMARLDVSGMSDFREKWKSDNTKFAWAISLKAGWEVQAVYDSKDWKIHMDSRLWYMSEIFPSQWWRTAFLDWVITNHNIIASSNIVYKPNDTTQISGFAKADYNTLRENTYSIGASWQKTIWNGLGLEAQGSVWLTTSKLDSNAKFANVQWGLNYQLNPQTNIWWGVWADISFLQNWKNVDPYVYAKIKHMFETWQTITLNAQARKSWASIGTSFVIPTK